MKAPEPIPKAKPLKEPLSVVNAKESKVEDESNVEDTTYPGKEDGLDSLSFMARAKAALMTFSEDMLIRQKTQIRIAQQANGSTILTTLLWCKHRFLRCAHHTKPGNSLGRLHDDSQSEVFYYAIFISSKIGLGGWSQCPRRVVLSLAIGITLNGIDRSSLPSSTSSGVKPAKKAFTILSEPFVCAYWKIQATSSLFDLIQIISQSGLLDSKWDKDSLKVLTELPRSQSMKVLALLVGSLVIVVMQNEGTLLHFHDMGKDHRMRKRKKRCKEDYNEGDDRSTKGKSLDIVEPSGYDALLLEYHGIEYPDLPEALEKAKPDSMRLQSQIFVFHIERRPLLLRFSHFCLIRPSTSSIADVADLYGVLFVLFASSALSPSPHLSCYLSYGLDPFRAFEERFSLLKKLTSGGEAFNIMMKETIREGPTLLASDLLNASAVQSSAADGLVVADGLLLAIKSTLTARVDGLLGYPSMLSPIITSNYIQESHLPDVVLGAGMSKGLQRDIRAKKNGLQSQGVASVPDNYSSSSNSVLGRKA
nr:proteasome subunit alpha type-1 [Tanacetum cinerariifolium]